MKKLNYLLLGLAGLAMASCSNDDLQAPGGDGNFKITVKLPGDLATRSMSDGLTADNLHVAVYDANNGNSLVTTAEAVFGTNLETTVDLNLTNGKTYNIAFFAQSPESEIKGSEVYLFDAEAKKLTVQYENMLSDNNIADDYDCFYQLYNTGKVSNSNLGATVTLYRPVAQINWGTDDLDEDAIKNESAFGPDGQYILTNLTFDAYTTFSLLDNDVTGEPEPVEIKAFAAPVSEDFPVFIPETDPTTGEPTEVNSLKYVAMQFVLASKDVALYDLNLDINNELNENVKEVTNDIVTVHSAPLQANYRTNIYGSLLTNPNVFTVVKDPNWNKPDYEVDATTWDGVTVTKPTKNSAGQYAIYRASDLAGLAQMVSDGESFEGETVILSTDFDLGGYNFPSIGNATYEISEYEPMGSIEGNTFKGTFDGKGHTLSNLSISSGENTSAALIPVLDGGSFSNVTFNNVRINGNLNDSYANQTGIVGIIENGGEVSNVTVNGSVSGVQYTGGVVGVIITKGSVSNCTNNATVNGSKYMGGVVGAAIYCTEGYEMSITDCHNNGNVTSTNISANNDSKYMGGVVGMSSANVSGCSNTGNVSGVFNSTGGVVGEQRNTGYVKDCTNTGTVTQTGTNGDAAGAGGIVGFVRYWNYVFNPVQNPIVVSGNTNYASVSGYLYVGGIVGNWYYSGSCLNNTSYASSITAQNQFASGIVGTQQWAGHMPKFQPLGKLVVTGNKTSTPSSAIVCVDSPNLVNQIIYVNSSANVTLEDNQSGIPQLKP